MNKNNSTKIIQKCGIFILFLLALSSAAWAEDTEIFANETPPTDPNILFLVDLSWSMNSITKAAWETRLTALKKAFKTVISDPELTDVNIGLLDFAGVSSERIDPRYASGISFPVSPIDGNAHQILSLGMLKSYLSLASDAIVDPTANQTVRSYLPELLSSMVPGGYTPIVDSYYEAALYFRGDKPKWGLAAPSKSEAAHPSTYDGALLTTLHTIETGNTAICDSPNCGANCKSFTESASCAKGDLSCGLGTNCSTGVQNWGKSCKLESEAECLASDARFTSCTTNVTSDCPDDCSSGVFSPETGECVDSATQPFSIKTHAPNMCLEVNLGIVSQEVCTSKKEQFFYKEKTAPGVFVIRSTDGTCLKAATNSTTGLASGSYIGANLCGDNSSPMSKFRLSKGRMISVASGNCIDIPGAATGSGVGIQQLPCNGDASQQFKQSNESASSCKTEVDIICQYPLETTSCDHEKFSCDETITEFSISGENVSYKSPIAGRCEKNAIVMLSDGRPFNRPQTQADKEQTVTDIKLMTGITTDCRGAAGDAGRCGPELASFLATEDQRDDLESNDVVNTYTIGFDIVEGSRAETFLNAVAKAGGGDYFAAANSTALASVFKKIITEVSVTDRSFSTPVYTVDPASVLAHSRNIYIPLFQNSLTPRWSGNLKKFKLNDAGEIVDRTGKVAVSALGVLDINATDFWSTGNELNTSNSVTSGGAASQLDPANRNVLTDNGSALVALDFDSVSKQALSGSDDLEEEIQTTLIKFIQGYASDGTPRNHIGDILHSKPTVVAYSDKEVIFFGTNEGYLHAINTEDATETGGGEELFAYMPSPLLANIQGQYENTPLTGSIKRIYGVDGEMSLWIQDKNKNGKVDASTGDKAYLYFGLRRGGSAYYALDVTDPSNPSLLWKISDKTSGFSRLGQTWSKPTIGKLRYKRSGAILFEEVLIFGGGYDASVYDEEDAASRSTGNTKGSGIYIVSAKTGTLIWSSGSGGGMLDNNSGSGDMIVDSVPSSIRALDVNQDGSIDRLYFGDTGGNVWRADLNVDDVDDDASLHDVKKDARVYRFADLGSNTGSDNRKFFYEPDVSIFKHSGRVVSLVSIGSGYRAHPMNSNVHDNFFALSDENAMNIADSVPQPLTINDLADSSSLSGDAFLPTYKGWYRTLNAKGEKVLSSPLVFQGKVMFTTFSSLGRDINISQEDSCTVRTNNFGRAYVLNLMTGAATVDLDGDGQVTDKDAQTIIGHGDIPSTPSLVFNKPSNCTDDGCDHIVDVRAGKMQKPLIDSATVGGNVNLGEYLPKVFWLNNK